MCPNLTTIAYDMTRHDTTHQGIRPRKRSEAKAQEYSQEKQTHIKQQYLDFYGTLLAEVRHIIIVVGININIIPASSTL